ncbi:hypothetical protein E2C01_052675 [Portunus trituberculatus]|uniref:Uncharacterized protein n=1 Tax=Portunus trituberculatus TaxID=210409 RepID=A0A5B7GNV9_PORTR|nr:hypothetical protein [Portunus trituberculatus]
MEVRYSVCECDPVRHTLHTSTINEVQCPQVCIRGRCKSFRAKKNHQYRSSTKKQPGEGKEKKLMKKMVKKLMNKVKKKTRPRHEKKKDEVLEEVDDRNDEGREYKTGNSRKGENDDDASEENTEKQIRPSSKYVKLLKMMKEAKKSIKRIKVIKDKNSTKSDGKAKEDEILEISNNKTRETDVNDREDLRHDKDEKKQEKNQKLKRIIKQQVKKRLNFINGRGRGKDLSKIRKIESPTQIVIKERLNYVKDKGWKVNVLKIKKTKKMANRRVRVKDYTITCNGAQSQCKITTKRARKSNRMRQPPPNKGNKRLPLNASKKTNAGLGKERQTISVLTRKAALARSSVGHEEFNMSMERDGWSRYLTTASDCIK